MKRRLAAILAADVVGYSRLMGEDEIGTLERLKSLRSELMQPKITERKGRIVKLMGDGLLAEFPSVVEAVECAVEIQQSIVGRETYLPDEQRLLLRIGVNLGDIILDGSDIYGDGVNVAARLEGLANPGGLCVSGKVYEEIRNKLPTAFEDLGEQEIKNIREPVRVYRWTGAAADTMPGVLENSGAQLSVSNKPSIAVLPFTNLSGDQEQEYFSDGITEDIITELSRFRTLIVISRNSSFAFKGQAIKVKELAQDLGVRYVVEGSVRKAADRIRVTAQLIDAANGSHLWAERYDRLLKDIFAVQDEISQSIAAAIEPELGAIEGRRSRTRDPEILGAWDCYHQGLWFLYKFTVEGLEKAEGLFERAIGLDPEFGPAHARLAYVYIQTFWYGPRDSRNAALNQALAAGKRALALDDRDAVGHFSLGRAYTLQGQHELGIAEMETAVELNPGFAQAHFGLAEALSLADRDEEALPLYENAIRLSPHDPHLWTFFNKQAVAYYNLGKLNDAELCARTAVRLPNTTHWAFATLASILGNVSKLDEAVPIVQELRRRVPDFSCSIAKDDLHIDGRAIRTERYIEQYIAGLRNAGLPE